MAKTSNRRINIFLNGKAVEGSIKDIRKEWRKLNNDIGSTQIGTDEYRKKAKRISELKSVMDKHRNNLKSIDGAYKKVSSGLSKYLGLAAAGFGIREIVGYGRRVLDLGIQMDTLGRKAQTVFGEVLPEVNRQAELNAEAAGLSTKQYRDQAVAMGDLLKPMGLTEELSAKLSVNTLELAAANSQWTGGQFTTIETMGSFRKALLGSREELERYGIEIKQSEVNNRVAEKGLSGLTGEYKKQAEALVTLELITEKSADAQRAYKDGTDSAIRTQAELSAKFSEIQEKISTALLPVFTKLLNQLNKIADVGISIADAFVGFSDPVKGATQAFDEQAKKVSELEAELPDLLKRYEELSSKSSQTEKEQAELSKVIQRIGEVTPTAITEIDKYGNVLSINADASKEFLEAEKARLNFVNKESIQTIKQQIEDLESLAKLDKERIETGRQGLLGIKLSADRINELRENYKGLSQEIAGARAELARLQGESPVTVSPANGKTPEQIQAEAAAKEEELRRAAEAEKKAKERQKEAERELKDLERKQERLTATVEKFREESRINDLSEDEQKLERLRQRFDKEIALAKELEAQGVTDATEQRIELERLKEVELNQLRDELLAARTEKEKDQEVKHLQEVEEAKKAEKQRQIEEQQAIQAFLDESNLNQRQLELLQLEEQFNQVADLTSGNDEQLLLLLEAYRKKKKEINEKFDKSDRAQYIQAQKAQAEALAASFNAAGNIIKGVMDVIGNEAIQSTKLGKALALTQIGISSAEAIAKGTAAAAGVPFPANLGAIATTIATVLGNIGQARQILSSTRLPQKKKGGWLNARGQDDGVTYRAQYIGSPNTGMLPSHPVVLASEAGPEYFVSNKALENPYVVNHVRAIENITSMRQFREGGATEALPTSSTPTPSPTNEAQNALMVELKTSIDQLSVILANGIFARYDDDEIINFNKKFNELNSASGGTVLQ